MDAKSNTVQPLPVKIFNGGARSLRRLGVNAESSLTQDSLMSAAIKKTGLHDFGDTDDFLLGLQVLIESLEKEAKLNPFGRMYARQRIVSFLSNRLWAQECFTKYPEVLERPIEAPLIIVGPPRTGTTRLQRVIAADEENFLHMKAWEGVNPAPRLGKKERGWQARHKEAERLFGAAKLNPGAIAAHPTSPDMPEEEILLMDSVFAMPFSLLAYHTTPTFHHWTYTCDKTRMYNYTANLLRLIAWGRGDDPKSKKKWILKSPLHLLGLGALVEAFPDAKLVFTHREPTHQTVASTISLMWHWGIMHTDQPLRKIAGQDGMEFYRQMACKSAKVRAKLPDHMQLDIDYEDMNSDPAAVLERLYGFADVPYDDKTKQTHDTWLAASTKKGTHARHKYSLEDFGLTAKEVDRYIDCSKKRPVREKS